MGSARVSVIVTCFNLGKYLPEAIDSVRAQTFRDLEICVVDDGSTDAETKQVLQQLGSELVVVRSDNRGLSAARNLGVSHTSAEYICTVDADDVLEPTLLEKSVLRLDADPSLAFVSHWMEAFGDESWEWKPERCDFPALLDANTVNGAALVRRSVVNATDGWDEQMRDGCEDWDFWITLVEQGFTGAIIPEVLYRYRRRPDSMSRVKFAADGLADRYRQLVEKHAESFREHLPALFARRERDIAGNRARADDIDEHLELQLLPALARARDDLAAAERRVAAWRQERGLAVAQGFQNLEEGYGRLRRLRMEHEELQSALARQREEVVRLQELRAEAMREVHALRSSWSWRVTQPLRSIADMLQRRTRPRS
jgi:glycosyltransferase involved in cell wall biosynthesis